MLAIQAVEEKHLRKDLPQFKPGDTIKVQVKVVEGDKERLQAFEGICIRRRGTGLSATFTVRKVTYGVGVERTFFVNSPFVEKVEIVSHGDVRRARLFYLRGLSSRASRAKLKSKARATLSADMVSELVSEEAPVDAEAAETGGGEPAADSPAAKE